MIGLFGKFAERASVRSPIIYRVNGHLDYKIDNFLLRDLISDFLDEQEKIKWTTFSTIWLGWKRLNEALLTGRSRKTSRGERAFKNFAGDGLSPVGAAQKQVKNYMETVYDDDGNVNEHIADLIEAAGEHVYS